MIDLQYLHTNITEEKVILIVDDEVSFIQTIVEMLQDNMSHNRILTCINAMLVQMICQEAKPDIVILDWKMPEMNGIDVLRQLKRTPATRDIPVIISTGYYMDANDMKTALDNGAIDFIKKPIEVLELVARINSALALYQYFRHKIDYEKQIANLKIQQFRLQLESIKRELISKTMLLININQIYKEYDNNLKLLVTKCGTDCEVYKSVKELTSKMIAESNTQLWSELEVYFDKFNADFYQQLLLKFPQLTKNELKLCAYLRLNMSTKHIASITMQSVRSIEMARYRLREKFGLKGDDTQITNFLINIEQHA